jgi:hypothetical protein
VRVIQSEERKLGVLDDDASRQIVLVVAPRIKTRAAHGDGPRHTVAVLIGCRRRNRSTCGSSSPDQLMGNRLTDCMAAGTYKLLRLLALSNHHR